MKKKKQSKYIYLIIAPSGSGKTTLANMLEERCGYKQLQSYTTRPKRYSNETGHVFITSEEARTYFDQIVAYTLYNGYEYFSTSEQIDESDLYVIDQRGIDFFHLHYQGHKKPIIIYIDMPVWKRFWLMLKRGDGFKKSLKRIWIDRKEFARSKSEADIIIKNTDLEKSFEVMKAYISLYNS